MIINLFPGKSIYAIRYLRNVQVQNWKYKNEFSSFRNDIMQGTEFKVTEVNKTAGKMWVKVEIGGRDPKQYLKITGEEIAGNFRV